MNVDWIMIGNFCNSLHECREEFCPRNIQKTYFDIQLKLAIEVNLPLFLHCRAAHDDLLSHIKNFNMKYSTQLKGVVHTFDGSLDKAIEFIKLGFYIGINGCSLKHEHNLEVISK